MTQEEKDLLLKDLCGRLPYGVILQCCEIVGEQLYSIDDKGLINNDYDIEEVKPLLFPLSDMTEEQKEELFTLCNFYTSEDWEGKKTEILGIEIASRPDPAYCYDHSFRMWNIDMRAINWLLKNHFDIYELIPMGLAKDATNLNIY